MGEINEKQLASEYEKKIKDLFKERKRNSKSKSKKTKSKEYNIIGGKKSHKNRTRKHRK
uniref:Uncharacterized protein n=1 Tax=viral metagenome TaxID=1070528 RepID=A0A6C0HBD9_9ZZZZ